LPPYPNLAVWLGVAAIAGTLAVLDTASKHGEWESVVRTWGWQTLLAVNILIAMIVVYVFATWDDSSAPLTHAKVFGVVFGYPLLLRSKLFSFRTPQGEGFSAGPELVLQLFERLLIPGIKESVRQQSAQLLGEWRNADATKLANNVKDYLATHELPAGHPKSKADVETWVKQLFDDIAAATRDDNLRLVYQEAERVGGLRGVRWILSKSRK